MKSRPGWLLLTSVVLLAPCLPVAAADLSSYPMVGDTGSDYSQIWVQTTEPVEVQVRYWPSDHPEQAQISETVQTRQDRFRTGLIPLKGLRPLQSYHYQILIGAKLALEQTFSFRTAPLTQTTDPPEIKALIGSCFYIDDPLMKLFKLSFGTSPEIFNSMAETPADLMLWLGDNVYFAPFDLSSIYNMNRRYEKHRHLPELRNLISKLPQYATWDDHDFGPNNSTSEFWRRDDSLRLFKSYWANPRYGLLTTAGVFFSKQWGDLEFIVTDNRYHRDSNTVDPEKRAFFGAEQMAWLKNRLRSSQASFKLVVIGSPALNRYYNESFIQASAEFKELMGFLEQERIEGVVFISGDRHHADLRKLERPGAYPLYDFTSSPLTSKITQIMNAGEPTDDWRVHGTLVRQHNYGRLIVNGPAGQRVLTLEARGAAGQLLWDFQIPQQALHYP